MLRTSGLLADKLTLQSVKFPPIAVEFTLTLKISVILYSVSFAGVVITVVELPNPGITLTVKLEDSELFMLFDVSFAMIVTMYVPTCNVWVKV